MSWKWVLIFTIWYAVFLYGLGDSASNHFNSHINSIEAAKHFEPTLESGITALDCVSFQHQIDIVEYRCEIFRDEIKELETLKERVLLELSAADLRYSVKNALERLSEIETEILRLTKLAQDADAILKNIHNSFKHCLRKI